MNANIGIIQNRGRVTFRKLTSGVIVTTFVQLLETLVGTRNRMLKSLIQLEVPLL